MSDIKPLSYADPMEELKAIIANDFPDVDPSKYKVSLVKVSNGTGNSDVLLIGDPIKGVVGSLKVNTNRLDPAAVINKFGAVTKTFGVRVNAIAGSTTSIYNIIAHINNLLGTKLTVEGKYPDIADQTFIVPEKNQRITVSIGAVDSVTGDFPVSLRICPGKTFDIDIINAGAVLTDVVVTRGLNPFIDSSDNLIWTLEKQPIANPTVSAKLLLSKLDFSAVFGTAAMRAAAFGDTTDPGYRTLGSALEVCRPFIGEAKEQVRAMLESVGLTYEDGYGCRFYKSYTIAASVSVANATYCRTWASTSAYYGSTSSSTALMATPPVGVNKDFQYVMKIYPPGRNTLIYDASIAYDNSMLFFHFNAVTL